MQSSSPDLIIASPEVRRAIGWTAHHDDMARQIVEEFHLRLPRDQELVRQLALVRIQQSTEWLSPFHGIWDDLDR